MGKANRLLNEARKEVFAEISSKYDDSSNVHDDDDITTYTDEEDETMKIIDLSWDIRETLFEYVNDVAYPLCEYLDMDNMINYVEWVLEQNL